MQPINIDFIPSSRYREITLLTILRIKEEGIKEREGSSAVILAIMFAVGIGGV